MKLHYKSSGSGEPVVILHGLFGMLDNWATFGRYLSDAYAVYTPDLRNHGRSPHDEVFNYDVLAEDLRDFIIEHGLGPATVIGHSLGGKTAMLAALRWPQLISRMIVVDIAPRAYIAQHDTVIAALQRIDPGATSSRNEMEARMMEELHDIQVSRLLVKNLARNADGTLYWRMNLPVLTASYASLSKAIQADRPFPGPALFVRGGKSKYILDEDMEMIHALFPSSTLITIPGAGHWVHADAMEELLAVTRQFILSNPPNSSVVPPSE